jgi:glycerophosphoryl diester phosphodiesterase
MVPLPHKNRSDPSFPDRECRWHRTHGEAVCYFNPILYNENDFYAGREKTRVKKVLRIGHRGACGYAPENTLASFARALALGVDMIELDVYRCKSGEPVVIHDARLERTTDGTGYVAERTLPELKVLDAGAGKKIPLLSEVLLLVDARTQVNIELKGTDPCKAVAGVIEDFVGRGGWSYDNFLVSSFDHYALQRFAKLLPGVRRGALVSGIPIGYARCADKVGAYSLHLDKDFITPTFVRDARGRGMRIFVYTVDEPEDISRMKSLGVDGIFSNFPDRV